MNMNEMLRKFSIFIGFGLLLVSMFWSQDGFRFDLAGDGGGTSFALFIGWFLAIAVTVIQFVFSTNFKELNVSLIFFGIIAYSYSIYTNYLGINHFQGGDGNIYGAWVLALVLDGVPEPLIAWGLHQSLQGDWIGNLIKALSSSPASAKESRYTENWQPLTYQSSPKKNQKPYAGRFSAQNGKSFSGHGKPGDSSHISSDLSEELFQDLPSFLRERDKGKFRS